MVADLRRSEDSDEDFGEVDVDVVLPYHPQAVLVLRRRTPSAYTTLPQTAIDSMNGLSAPQPPVGVPLVVSVCANNSLQRRQHCLQTHVNAAGGAPRISPALLRGAMELTAIFEQRTAKIRADYEESIAKLRADYEEKIRVLTQERDAALAQASDLPQDGNDALNAELATLRAEIDTWRDQYEKERAQRVSERAQWEKEHSQDRAQWEQERERWKEDGSEQLLKWEQEKNAIAKERAIHQALEQQVDALQKEKTELQETNKTLLAQKAQLQSTDAHVSSLLIITTASLRVLRDRAKTRCTTRWWSHIPSMNSVG